MGMPHNSDLLRSALFNRCKMLWGVGLSVRFLVFAAGAAIILYPANAKLIGFATLVLSLLSEAILWQSDKWKGDAQSLHRKLDFEDGLGWPVTTSEIADLLARYPGNLDKITGSGKGSYFASTEPPGVKRALQNLCESSWWSMHLAESMSKILTGVIILVIVGCAILLNISVESLPTTSSASVTQTGQTTRDVVSASVVKIVTALLLFIVSFGLIRLVVGYFSFSLKSKQINEKAESLLEARCDKEVSAIRLWQDYHLSRASAPLLPTWIWWLRQKKLSALFTAYFHDLA
jgi:hypothetical protein